MATPVAHKGHPKQRAPVQLRWMIRRDLPEVVQLEQQSAECCWVEEDFLRCLQQRNCAAVVAVHDEKVVGVLVYESHKARLHLLNLVVHQQWRRLGVGERLIADLVTKLSYRRDRILLEVRETNLGAQLFFQKNGFRATGVTRRYFPDTYEAAFLLEYRLGGGGIHEQGGIPANRIAWVLD